MSSSVTIPELDDPRYEKLAKRCQSCRPMVMLRSSNEQFLLCYDSKNALRCSPRPIGSSLFTEFGLYVDRSGNPDTTKDTVEWEGTAEHVAWHPPYVFIFHLRFIEVRHVETGRLCQIIRGQDLRCTWDGCGLLVPLPQPELGIVGAWGEAPVQRTPVWGVMRTDDLSQGPTSPSDTAGTVVQRVFELVPTTSHNPAEDLSLPTQQ